VVSEMTIPICYQCKWRRDIPGDAHSSCHHPAFENVWDNSFAQIVAILGKRAGVVAAETRDIYVRGHPHGVARGWFNHPMNFDPVWLQECTGFTAVRRQNPDW
jgi:hypothetical protein